MSAGPIQCDMHRLLCLIFRTGSTTSILPHRVVSPLVLAPSRSKHPSHPYVPSLSPHLPFPPISLPCATLLPSTPSVPLPRKLVPTANYSPNSLPGRPSRLVLECRTRLLPYSPPTTINTLFLIPSLSTGLAVCCPPQQQSWVVRDSIHPGRGCLHGSHVPDIQLVVLQRPCIRIHIPIRK
ncbi:hypothetical protein E2C01_079986 [Portunus trituberculatus]|uniref:Uncharacterized protein n=1 Tax=Portunus trituberculatus TaxID=210409 RepID=A0A5B7IMX7_PORTR|nr:hypothetical protein [Portunus trituberculatus]